MQASNEPLNALLTGVPELARLPGRDLVEVARYLIPLEANLVQGCLVASGIPAVLADAHLVQSNVLPINEPDPVTGEPRRIDLPAVAVDVPEGQTLYVIASPLDDIFVGMGSRPPGAVVLDNTVAHLPVVHH